MHGDLKLVKTAPEEFDDRLKAEAYSKYRDLKIKRSLDSVRYSKISGRTRSGR